MVEKLTQGTDEAGGRKNEGPRRTLDVKKATALVSPGYSMLDSKNCITNALVS